MKKSYRTKNYTQRVSKITTAGINQLRATQLRHAKTDAQRRFINSASFDRRIRENIRDNRIQKNREVIRNISKFVRNPSERRQLESFFSEGTKISNGRVVKTNSFASVKQTQRLNKIQKQIQKGTFNPLRNIKSTSQYKEKRKYIPKGAGLKDILRITDRSNFYLDNQADAREFNKLVNKYGKVSASKSAVGQRLSNAYNENKSDMVLDLLEAL